MVTQCNFISRCSDFGIRVASWTQTTGSFPAMFQTPSPNRTAELASQGTQRNHRPRASREKFRFTSVFAIKQGLA